MGKSNSYASPLDVSLGGRIPELDGLRGVAISLVVICHYFQSMLVTTPGTPLAYLQAAGRLCWSGVDLFFVLSGFLIGGILIDSLASKNYYAAFYQRRFFRIVPLYAVTLLVFPVLVSLVRAIHGGEIASWLRPEGPPWYAYWTFTQNFWMAHAASFGADGLGMTWSLAVEEQFYLTLPLYIRALSGRWLTRAVVIGICGAPLLRGVAMLLGGKASVGIYTMMLCRADALLLGVLAAIALRNSRWRERISNSRVVFAVAIPILLGGLGVLTLRGGSWAGPLTQSAGFTWLAVFYVTMLLYAVTKRESVLSRVLRFKWLGWLGTLAYGTYLMHQPVQYLLFGLLFRRGPTINGASSLLATLAALAITLVLASVSWRLFEQPLLRIGRRARFEMGTTRPAESIPEARLVY